MPCSDSSSSITIKLDPKERFVSFDFAKITCGREISAKTGYSDHLKGRTLEDILALSLTQIANDLALKEDEAQFILYLEWDALRATLGQYLGIVHDDIDTDRCQITSIEHTDQGIEVALVILPPKEMPKTLPCNLGDERMKYYSEEFKRQELN